MNNISYPRQTTDMVPVIFEGCCGWFHPTPAGHTGGTAVLLCHGAGEDFANGYRPVRILADHLAKSGYPALRFDYPNTGNSADAEDDNLWQAWQKSTAHAATWLRSHTGATRLLLVGIRIGAILATMTAARRGDIAGLVLIEPCLTGRSYVSQLVTEAKLRDSQQGNGTIEVGGLVFTLQSLEQIRGISLAQLELPYGLPVTIFSRTPEEKISTRLATWHERNINPACNTLCSLDAVMRPNHHSGEPELDPSILLGWLQHNILPNAPIRATCPQPDPEALFLAECLETTLRFGKNWHLVGTLCRPRLNHVSGLAVLICNAGGNPRYGFARFGVECARMLARAGIASLRFDFAGLGDSIHSDNGVDCQTDVFNEDRITDISAALDALEALGFYRFALSGLCSGAYHALHASCADRRITHLITINLPWFSVQFERPGPASLAQHCMATLSSQDVVSLFLFGSQDPGLKQFERNFGMHGCLLPASSNISLCVVNGIDHELTTSPMRKMVISQIIRSLQGTRAKSECVRIDGGYQYGHA